jgi:hypothetical protein
VGNYKLLNLRGKHLINTLAAFVFVPSVFGENIQAAKFGGMISVESACWDKESK